MFSPQSPLSLLFAAGHRLQATGCPSAYPTDPYPRINPAAELRICAAQQLHPNQPHPDNLFRAAQRYRNCDGVSRICTRAESTGCGGWLHNFTDSFFDRFCALSFSLAPAKLGRAPGLHANVCYCYLAE